MNLVVLWGPAAVGKLTVAREVSAVVGYPVFHNHLVVDLLTTVFPFGTEPFVRLRDRMWLDVFAAAAAAGRSLVFTFAPEDTVPIGFGDRVERAVGAAGTVRWVELRVARDEQVRRLASPGRREFHKLTDPALLGPAEANDRDPLPAELVVDTRALAPAEAAATVVRTLGLRPEPALPRYPFPAEQIRRDEQDR